MNIYYYKKLKNRRYIKDSITDLQNFEKEIAEDYEVGKIRGPIHLSKGNEKNLIDIFKKISINDWVFSSWRNHLHAILHGVDKKGKAVLKKRGIRNKLIKTVANIAILFLICG